MTTRRSTGCTGTRCDAGSGTRDAPAAVLTRRLPADPAAAVHYRLALTAEERTRSRLRFTSEEGAAVRLGLARGTVLRDGDLLTDDDGATRVRVHARPEPVLAARSGDPRTLLRAAYHLGNRHVPVEIGDGCVRLAPDAVLAGMLRQLGLEVLEETAPFEPEAGAYGGHSHAHAHDHSHSHGS